jgi:hypothetical protein
MGAGDVVKSAVEVLVGAHGVEAVLDALGGVIRDERSAFIARAKNERQDAKDIRLVSALLESAAEKVQDASMDYYVSTK